MSYTNPEMFKRFVKLLQAEMPAEYTPHLFKLQKEGKDPDVWGSWKSSKNRLSVYEAAEYLKAGYNIGIAATREDALVIVDIDDISKTPLDTLKPTLTVRSSKRVGFHCFYRNESPHKIPNIATGGCGEVRANWQYVVAAGSYVPRSKQHIASLPEDLRESAGQYTIELDQTTTTITFDELPPVFRERHEANKKHQAEHPKQPKTHNNHKTQARSRFFDLRIEDVCPHTGGRRVPHPLHESDTGKNWSVSDGLGHCWRHEVSLNAQQYLAVESGKMQCEDAGTPHGGGSSRYEGNDEALFHAVQQAWKRGLCGKNDRVPFRVIKYLARSIL